MSETTPGPASDTLLDAWTREQLRLKEQLVEEDRCEWRAYLPDDAHPRARSDERLRLVAGVDLSFYEDDERRALAALVVQSYPDFRVLYTDFAPVELEHPYRAGYLAFREAPPLLALLRKLKENAPELWPQVLFVDGNGTLHPRRFGLACHVGVQADLPTIGIGKNFLQIHEEGEQLTMDAVKRTSRATLLQGGQWFPLRGESGLIYGAAVRTLDSAPNPIFVSVGHRLSLATAVATALCCCRYRVPEPVRQADIMSREYIRRE
ncbi:endonuclease V-domain-containing protein [Syncephalis pseudoplumigaleata]|uniref:Endonuclease V-domain-containing protein n=1 Tax=Syncephalis pseudoplumigaleata TaxID=1712513 RepID=A0A4P9YWL5_9FUNG|nr:endonuclease V-domain-containing protein [Syncephalis pseudoplumigaleata]|eukprot:RKP24503.1 endonuclease V-domain-containing protein [Syncephalis pseudoplumigaleata]